METINESKKGSVKNLDSVKDKLNNTIETPEISEDKRNPTISISNQNLYFDIEKLEKNRKLSQSSTPTFKVVQNFKLV